MLTLAGEWFRAQAVNSVQHRMASQLATSTFRVARIAEPKPRGGVQTVVIIQARPSVLGPNR